MHRILILYFVSLSFTLDCIDDVEVSLWGQCYNIKETTRLSVSGAGLTGNIPNQIEKLTNYKRRKINSI